MDFSHSSRSEAIRGQVFQFMEHQLQTRVVDRAMQVFGAMG